MTHFTSHRSLPMPHSLYKFLDILVLTDSRVSMIDLHEFWILPTNLLRYSYDHTPLPKLKYIGLFF